MIGQGLKLAVRANLRTQSAVAGLRQLTKSGHRRHRLGLATTRLPEGGHFGFDRGDCLHGQLRWFNEYDLSLGKPLGAFREDRYGPGTFCRDFEHGLVVVNPTDAAVSVAGDAELTNRATGATAEALQVPPHDARILLRK